MKNILRLLALAILGTGLASCSGFLTEKLTTSINGPVAISSEEALEANVFGIHRTLAASGFKKGAFCEWLAPASGIAHWGNTSALTNPLERWACCLKFTRFSQHPEAYESFSSFYTAIYQCNLLLGELPDCPVDEPYKKEIEGEVLFFRAMAYFYLVRLYGDVSLYTEVPENTSEIEYRPRENFWTVYCRIVEDLNQAASQMRSYDRMIQVTGGNASGRVCNYAAIACRSLVYLTIGTLLAHPDDNFWVNRTPDFSGIGIFTAQDAFRKALADAEDVILHGPFELCPDYRQLFRWTDPADWQLKERIWAMPRAPETSDSESGLTMWALPCYYMGTEQVLNFGRCRPDRWFFQKWCETYGGEKGTGSNNSDIYVDCPDPRLEVNLIYNSYPGRDNVPYNCYPADNRIYPGDETLLKYYGLPYYKKYYDPTFNNSVGNSDLYVMRLAEVYLIAAEASANLCASPSDQYGSSAIEYVNVILQRARNSTDNPPAAEPQDWGASDFSTREELLDAIFWERCFEMPFEHHEYFDTHRMGARWIVENISKPKNIFLYQKEQEDYTVDGETRNGYRTIYYGNDFRYDEDWTLVRKGLISAYPYDELIYNTSLDETKHDPNFGQNPQEVYWR